MRNFFILDGSWYLFRAYYALPELNDKDWNNVNAIYGFFRMMFKLLQKKPDNFVIAWDSPVKTIRHQQYENYKINRPPLPDNFKRQIWQIKEIVDKLKIPYIQMPWYEADDIIHCIVKNCWAQLTTYTIVSSDKDLKQLLWPNVVFFDAMKNLIITKEDFILENWFDPVHILDYLSLVGDSSDNIPWVNWIWKKTAQDLVSKYGNLDNIYANIESITGAAKEKLITWKDIAYKSKDLITLYQVPGMECVRLEEYKPNFDFDKFKQVLIEQYNFASMDKHIEELKKNYKGGQQASLF